MVFKLQTRHEADIRAGRPLSREPAPTAPTERDGHSTTLDLPIDELWLKPSFRSAGAKFWAALRHPSQLRAIRERPYFRAPVKWLLGRDLLTYFRRMAAYAAYADEMDHRDWMDASPIELDAPQLLEGNVEGQVEGKAFWFDYLSDTGDGQLTMYNLAYLVLGDLWLHGDQVALASDTLGGAAERLPRGRLLVVGGDTAYHVADQATLEERFRAPFNWAHADRRARGNADQGVGKAGTHYIAAIPGNHDYYDTLTGFNRLFRKHSRYLKTDDYKTHNAGRIADFERCQEASFFALKLPHRWQLWGLDSQGGHMDFRQRRFFGQLRREAELCHLIVLTPEPSTVFGRICKESVEPFKKLQLPRPFIKGEPAPAPSSMHLDLAGDVHHYVRHQTRHNYASVVAGGGAFLHPTHTRQRSTVDGARAPSWPPASPPCFPPPRQALLETTRRLLCPWHIFQGGYVWLLGAAALLAIYFGVTVPVSTQGISTWLSRHLVHAPAQQGVSDLVTSLATHVLVAEGELHPERLAAEGGLDRLEWVTAVLLSFWLLLVPLVSAPIFARATRGREPVWLRHYGYVGAVTLPVAVLIGVCWVQLGGMQPVVRTHPFICSLLFVLYLAPLPVSLWWTYRYLETLPKQAKRRAILPRDEAPRWLALAFGLLATSFAVLAYGATSLSTLAVNVVFMLACSAVVLGPVRLARSAVKGLSWGEHLAVMLAGLVFGGLLMVTPTLLTLYGSVWQAAASLVAVTLVAVLTLRLHAGIQDPVGRERWKSRSVLVAGWALAACASLAPLAVERRVHDVTLARLGLAALLGACFTCVWLGWYLGVASAFNAHNNEVGGAVRLDKHRHFIRFKLESNRLTGYVIALERASLDCADPAREASLQARLIDTIELSCAPPFSQPVPRHEPRG
jgi:hypothetical protein